jgi:hypothetical protein
VTVEQIPSMVEVRRTFTPDPSTAEEYGTLFREFVTLYKQTKGIFKRLNRF